MLAAGQGTHPTTYTYPISYNGRAYATLIFDIKDFYYDYAVEPSAGHKLHSNLTGVTAGSYSAVTVDAKGRVTAGGKSVEWGTSGQNAPSDDLMVGGLFFELQ